MKGLTVGACQVVEPACSDCPKLTPSTQTVVTSHSAAWTLLLQHSVLFPYCSHSHIAEHVPVLLMVMLTLKGTQDPTTHTHHTHAYIHNLHHTQMLTSHTPPGYAEQTQHTCTHTNRPLTHGWKHVEAEART